MGWKRAKPKIGEQWQFFEHCSPIILASILIESLEAVEAKAESLKRKFLRPKSQARKDVSTGNVLSRCFNRGFLIQPKEGDIRKCLRHVFFVLAALETINVFLRTPRIDMSTLSDIVRLRHID
jgi:hypothetical protein